MRYTTLFIGMLLLALVACEKDKDEEDKKEPEYAETEIHSHEPVIENIGNNCPGYYVGLPGSYAESDRNYPLLISFHGYGALGGTFNMETIVSYSVGKLLQDQVFPKNVVHEGKNYSFIVVTPRFRERPTAADARLVLDYILSRYRVDQSRIYMAGASMGGTTAFEFAGDYPDQVAAIVPFATARTITDVQAERIAQTGLPIWAFHNRLDDVAPLQNTLTNISLINGYAPDPAPRLTIFEEGMFEENLHDAWTEASDPAYKEEGLNIYEWMLQYQR